MVSISRGSASNAQAVPRFFATVVRWFGTAQIFLEFVE
jgi:hypothetical protein